MREHPGAALPSPPLWLVLSILAVAALGFAPTLNGGFLGGDFVYVSRFYAFPWSDWPRLFTREWSEGIWGFQLSELRPFTALSFMLDGRLYGGEAFGYRVTNLGLHLLVVLAITSLAWRYSRGNRFCALVAGLVFAFHPAHLEPVAWITGRVDVLSTACGLWFWAFAEAWSERGKLWQLAVALLVLAVGVFAKEVCLFAPPLLLSMWVLVDARAGRSVWLRRACVVLGVIALALVYNACRRAAFGDNATAPGSTWHNLAAWQRQASYLGWLAPVLPFRGQAEFSTPWNPTALRLIGSGIAFAIVAGLLASAWRNGQRFGRALFFTGGWWLVTVGGLLLVGYFSPRHLYFPTAGLAIGAGLVLGSVRSALLRTGAAVLAIGWLAVGHGFALRPWIENGKISRALIATAETDAAKAPPGSVALVTVPAVRGLAWLWSWGCPHALGRPFLTTPFAHNLVLSDPGCYYRPESWPTDFKPIPAIAAAPGAIALAVADDGRILHRVLAVWELTLEAKRLEGPMSDGVLAHHEWSEWVRSVVPK